MFSIAMIEQYPVLLGYDVVAYRFISSYQNGGVAVRGLREHNYNHEGYQFWFSSKENRQLFIGDPWKYQPAFGGFSVSDIAESYRDEWSIWNAYQMGPPVSPTTGWAIIDDLLIFQREYVNDTNATLYKDHIDTAKAQWTQWFGSVYDGPFNTHCISDGPLQDLCLEPQKAPWMDPWPDCATQPPSSYSGVITSDSPHLLVGTLAMMLVILVQML